MNKKDEQTLESLKRDRDSIINLLREDEKEKRIVEKAIAELCCPVSEGQAIYDEDGNKLVVTSVEFNYIINDGYIASLRQEGEYGVFMTTSLGKYTTSKPT